MKETLALPILNDARGDVFACIILTKCASRISLRNVWHGSGKKLELSLCRNPLQHWDHVLQNEHTIPLSTTNFIHIPTILV